jgi:hypothetical protein
VSDEDDKWEGYRIPKGLNSLADIGYLRFHFIPFEVDQSIWNKPESLWEVRNDPIEGKIWP